MRSISHPICCRPRKAPPVHPAGFTLIELLVVIVIIGILAALLFPALGKVRSGASITDAISRQQQLYLALASYATENNRLAPGDEGKTPEGGGRGIIWINYLAPYLGQPELAIDATNFHAIAWEDITRKYVKSPWVCPAIQWKMSVADSSGPGSGTQLDRVKQQTPDPIGGVGYNVKPLLPEQGNANANWDKNWKDTEFVWSRLNKLSHRGIFASSYDWHLEHGGARAYHRFGKNKAVMVFMDGSARFVTQSEFDMALDNPGQ